MGAGTGTNESCATAEDIGIVTTGNSVVISGSLFTAGVSSFTGDFDYYKFTAGSASTYTFSLDCYSNNIDNNLLDIVIFDVSCNYVFDPGATKPGIIQPTPPFNPGDVYYLLITAYNGAAPIPYHFTISAP